MGRFRARFSTSPVDREIGDKVEQSHRLIESAIRVCEPLTRDKEDLARAQRARSIRRDLERVLGALDSVRLMSTGREEEQEDAKKPPRKRPVDPTPLILQIPMDDE